MKTGKLIRGSACAVLLLAATGCMLNPLPNSWIGAPNLNVNFSGFVSVPNDTIIVQYQTPNGIWNNVGSTQSDAFMTDGVYNWALTDNIPNAGWEPVDDDYQTKIRIIQLSTGDHLANRAGEYVTTLYAAGPEG